MAVRTVRVFQDAVEGLADSPDDDIFQTLDNLAERVAEAAFENAVHIIPAVRDEPGLFIVEAGKDTKGIFFRIQTDGQGRWSQFFAKKEILERNILAKAVDEVVHGGLRPSFGGRALHARRLARVGRF